MPSYPAGAASTRAAALNQTVAAPGGRLATVAWTLGVALTFLQDNNTQPPTSVAGYQLSSQLLKVTTAQWGSHASGLLLAQPAAAAVQVVVAIPLQPFVVHTQLAPLMAVSTLIANLIGLTSILSAFGFLFAKAEELYPHTARLLDKTSRLLSDRKPAAIRGEGGGSGSPAAVGEGGGAAAGEPGSPPRPPFVHAVAISSPERGPLTPPGGKTPSALRSFRGIYDDFEECISPGFVRFSQ